MTVESIGQAASQVSKVVSDSEQVEGVWGKDGFTFADILDVINPLQHIPGVSKIYRELTGDEIGDAPRVLGGAIFGGVAGLLGASINSLVRRESGMDIEDHVVALLEDAMPGVEDSRGPTAYAQTLATVDDDSLDRFFAEMSDGATDGFATATPALARERAEVSRSVAAQAQAAKRYQAIELVDDQYRPLKISG